VLLLRSGWCGVSLECMRGGNETHLRMSMEGSTSRRAGSSSGMHLNWRAVSEPELYI
jgi:hypothetical protein